MGDNNNNGASWACYDNGGMPCSPGADGCPCQYVAPSVSPAAPTGTGAGQCVICPAVPTTGVDQAPPLDPCNNAQGCGPWAPGVFYGDCLNTVHAKSQIGQKNSEWVFSTLSPPQCPPRRSP